MKTLDEVIKALHYWDSCDEFPESFYDFEVTRDALHYLKELKDILDPLKVKKISHEITCPQCNSVIAILSPESNEPLTWDELREMEGKPVWVEALLYKQWAVIAYVGSDHIRFEGANLYAPESRVYMGEANGWQAYRKERTNA